MYSKYDPTNLILDVYDYSEWYKEESHDLSTMQQLEGDEEEVEEGKGIKILTPNELLTRLLILLVKIKA